LYYLASFVLGKLPAEERRDIVTEMTEELKIWKEEVFRNLNDDNYIGVTDGFLKSLTSDLQNCAEEDCRIPFTQGQSMNIKGCLKHAYHDSHGIMSSENMLREMGEMPRKINQTANR
jgi:hypothetical protein